MLNSPCLCLCLNDDTAFIVEFLLCYDRGLTSCSSTDAEICNTFPCMQTDNGSLLFSCGPLGRLQKSYFPVPRLYREHAQKLRYKTKLMSYLFFHVNFDHAWVEYYLVTLIFSLTCQCFALVILRWLV